MTDEYPINTSELEKGSRVAAETVEASFNVKRGTDAYRIKMLQVRKYIEWRLAERGMEVVTRSQRDDIIILTDAEAAPFTDREFQNTVRKLRRRLIQQSSVDRAALSDVERTRHDRALTVNGATYAGTRAAQQKALAPIRPQRRMTPGKS